MDKPWKPIIKGNKDDLFESLGISEDRADELFVYFEKELRSSNDDLINTYIQLAEVCNNANEYTFLIYKFGVIMGEFNVYLKEKKNKERDGFLKDLNL